MAGERPGEERDMPPVGGAAPYEALPPASLRYRWESWITLGLVLIAFLASPARSSPRLGAGDAVALDGGLPRAGDGVRPGAAARSRRGTVAAGAPARCGDDPVAVDVCDAAVQSGAGHGLRGALGRTGAPPAGLGGGAALGRRLDGPAAVHPAHGVALLDDGVRGGVGGLPSAQRLFRGGPGRCGAADQHLLPAGAARRRSRSSSTSSRASCW